MNNNINAVLSAALAEAEDGALSVLREFVLEMADRLVPSGLKRRSA